jgi:hypothetical protein
MAQEQINMYVGEIQVKEMTLEEEQVPDLSYEFKILLSDFQHNIPTFKKNWNNYTKDETKAIISILTAKSSTINYLLEFYMSNIYPYDYYFGINFALESLSKNSNRDVIVNKILKKIDLTDEEESIIDYGGHSGCSFMGLRYWLRVIFNKMSGDSYDNYHLVFDEGEHERKVKLFCH